MSGPAQISVRKQSRTQATLDIHSDDRVLITGRPEVGKTTFVKYLATLRAPEDVKIVDPLEQYTGFMDECRIIPPDRNPREEMDVIARQIMAQGNVTLFIEEAQKYLPESSGGRIGPETMAMLNRGRNYGIGVVAVCQRFQAITKNMLDLSSNLIFFAPGAYSRDAIRRMFPGELSTAINSLPPHEYIFYDLRRDCWGRGKLIIPQGAAKMTSVSQLPSGTRNTVSEFHKVQ